MNNLWVIILKKIFKIFRAYFNFIQQYSYSRNFDYFLS